LSSLSPRLTPRCGDDIWLSPADGLLSFVCKTQFLDGEEPKRPGL